jgi:hypothetical protein
VQQRPWCSACKGTVATGVMSRATEPKLRRIINCKKWVYIFLNARAITDSPYSKFELQAYILN